MKRRASVELEFGLPEWALYGVVGYVPGSPGTMYARNGDPGDPPEPAEFDLGNLELRDEDGNVVPLPQEALDALLEKHREAIELQVAEKVDDLNQMRSDAP